MTTWSIYIDPVERAPKIADSRLAKCTAALANCQHALLSLRGSIEGLPGYGAGLLDIETVAPNAVALIERRIDQAMRFADGGWDSYDRTVYLSRDGYPVAEITLYLGDQQITDTFPLRS